MFSFIVGFACGYGVAVYTGRKTFSVKDKLNQMKESFAEEVAKKMNEQQKECCNGGC